MEISLKLESMPTLCRSAFLPADITITRRVAATIEVASSVVHWKEYCFPGSHKCFIIMKHKRNGISTYTLHPRKNEKERKRKGNRQ